MNLYEIGDIWYQRAHRLREYSEDENISLEKRTRAFTLFLKMVGRVMNISTQISLIQMPKSKFPRGGEIKETGYEYFTSA